MKLKGDPKFKGKMTPGLKNDIENLVDFNASSQKSENLHFNRIFLSKANKDLDGKVNTEELCFITLKIDAEKLTLSFKNNMMILVNFNASSGKSENFHFDDVLLLSIAYNVSTEKVQKNDLS